jgi:glycosyltransferase involved in cell wall biosynthesis
VEKKDEHMRKPKIVFVTRRMMMGGIEKALISMLEQIPEEKYDLTLLVVHQGGELYDQIPSHVKVKSVFNKEERIAKTMWKYIVQGKIISAFSVILNAFLLRRKGNTEIDEFIYYSKTRPPYDEQYDLAISYSDPLTLPVVYVAKNIKARKKVFWIHSNMEELVNKDSEALVKRLTNYYKSYDNIFCVSQHTLNRFNNIFPELSVNASVFYNILDEKKIMKSSLENESFNDGYKGVRILTAGRLSREKGQDIIPYVLLKLLEDGYNVRWYCIGDGPILGQMERLIKNYRLENNLILLGIKQNPLPYFKDCDIYIQTSQEESYCITVAEARALHKPIITTNTGASEQIIHEKTGLVVESDEKQLYESIKRLLNNPMFKETLVKNLSMEKVSTIAEMEKFYETVEKID